MEHGHKWIIFRLELVLKWNEQSVLLEERGRDRGNKGLGFNLNPRSFENRQCSLTSKTVWLTWQTQSERYMCNVGTQVTYNILNTEEDTD